MGQSKPLKLQQEPPSPLAAFAAGQTKMQSAQQRSPLHSLRLQRAIPNALYLQPLLDLGSCPFPRLVGSQILHILKVHTLKILLSSSPIFLFLQEMSLNV
ncbi:MAG: hypothetical protein ACK559_00970, partial [bacterium]